MQYFFIIIIIALFANRSHANELELEVVSENWPPFITQGKETSGIVTDKIKSILEETHINYEINVYPWARSYHLATTKPNVLIYSIYRSKQREDLFHWFCPIHKSTPIRAYKLKSNAKNIDSLAALKSSIVGIMRGDNSHSFLTKNGFKDGVTLDVSADEKTNIRKLINGKVDVVIQSEESLRYRLKEVNAEYVNVVGGFVLHNGKDAEHCMALSKGTQEEIIEKVSKSFDAWQLKN